MWRGTRVGCVEWWRVVRGVHVDWLCRNVACGEARGVHGHIKFVAENAVRVKGRIQLVAWDAVWVQGRIQVVADHAVRDDHLGIT